MDEEDTKTRRLVDSTLVVALARAMAIFGPPIAVAVLGYLFNVVDTMKAKGVAHDLSIALQETRVQQMRADIQAQELRILRIENKLWFGQDGLRKP